MNELYLSKSKYCKAKQCMKITWMDKYLPEEKIDKSNEAVLKRGTLVGELAKGLFGNYSDVEYSSNKEEMLEQTIKYIESNSKIITEASFVYDNNFCSVDILKNNDGEFEIYEVKSSGETKDIYIDDVSYQYYILSNLGYKIKSANIVHINKEYVRHGEIEVEKLFEIENVTDNVLEKQKEIENKINELNLFMKENKEKEPNIDIGMQCRKPYVCDYWEYCTRNLPKPNVFDIAEMHWDKKFEKYYEGKYSYKDLINEKLNEKYLEQIDFELNDKQPKIDKEKIKEFLDTLSYPIYFLDFETFQDVIPQFDNESPYKQIPFQYSLHYIEEEDGELKHKEFLGEAGVDPRRPIAESLVKNIPKDVCVLAYNMSFEKGQINILAELFPDLREHLLNIHDNIKDLMIPFEYRYYYNKKFNGAYTIKIVLPTLFPDDPELDYHNLPVVHNGGEASETYLSLLEKTKEEQESIRKGLLLYCGLDTLAMVKIWEKLKEMIKRGEVYGKD